jgi:hypothetical protein
LLQPLLEGRHHDPYSLSGGLGLGLGLVASRLFPPKQFKNHRQNRPYFLIYFLEIIYYIKILYIYIYIELGYDTLQITRALCALHSIINFKSEIIDPNRSI